MQKYKIKDIYRDGKGCHVVVSYSQKYSVKLDCLTKKGTLTTTKTIDLPKKVIDALKVGNKICVCQNKYFDSEPYVYIYRGGMFMPNLPISCDKYSCKRFIKNLSGVFDGFKFDRAAFKIALMRDCWQRDVWPTLVAWRNLRKVCLDEKYPLLKQMAEMER